MNAVKGKGSSVFELRRLRLLHELALRGTLASVAEALSYSPSTISQQLAQLEKDAGVPLLIPDGRRVRLTEHGVALAAHAARALELEEQIRGELESLQPGLALGEQGERTRQDGLRSGLQDRDAHRRDAGLQ